MISLIETLFGLAIAAGLVAVGLGFQRRRTAARRLGFLAVACGVAAVLLEIYVRVR
jgi:hypothetical protein